MKLKRLIWILLFTCLITGAVRMLLLDTFSIASEAMADSQKAGNRLLVEKWSLGARIPQAIGLPQKITGKNHWDLSERFGRFPSLSSLQRNEVVVFNQPMKNDSIPINLRPILFSRCVGLPGEAIKLECQRLVVNGMLQNRSIDALYCYTFDSSQKTRIHSLLPHRTILEQKGHNFVFIPKHEFIRLNSQKSTVSAILRPYASDYDTFNTVVPYKGYQLTLDSLSFTTWKSLINAHEGVVLTNTSDHRYLLNGKLTDQYTFKQNYYVVLNDHQGYLNDSRTFGLVPASHIIGRALLVLFSPSEKHILEKIN